MIEKKKIISKILFSLFILIFLSVINNFLIEKAEAYYDYDDITVAWQYLDQYFYSTQTYTDWHYNPDTGYLVAVNITGGFDSDQISYIYCYYVDKAAKTITLTDEQAFPYHSYGKAHQMTFDGTYYHIAACSRIFAYTVSGGNLNLECDQEAWGFSGAANSGCLAISSYGDFVFVGACGGFGPSCVYAVEFNGTAYNYNSSLPSNPIGDTIGLANDGYRIYQAVATASVSLYIWDFDEIAGGFTAVDEDHSYLSLEPYKIINDRFFATNEGGLHIGKFTGDDFSWVDSSCGPVYDDRLYIDTSEQVIIGPSAGWYASYGAINYYDYATDTAQCLVRSDHTAQGPAMGFNDNLLTNDGIVVFGNGKGYYMAVGEFDYPLVYVSQDMGDDWWNVYTNVTNLPTACGNVAENGTIRIWEGEWEFGDQDWQPATYDNDLNYNNYATFWGNGSGAGTGNNTEITGILKVYGDHNTFYNMNFSNDVTTYGANNYFLNCVFMDTVEVYGSSNSFINCTFYASGSERFRSLEHNMYYENCTFYGNDYPAFYINGDNSIIYNCDFISDDGTVDQKVVELGSGATNDTFVNCDVTAPDDEYAFYLTDAQGGNTVYGCTASDMTYGFALAANDNAYYCTIEDSDYGFIATGTSSDSINISGCTIDNCNYGIDTSGYINVTGNEISNCSSYGINIDVGYLNVTGNHFVDNNIAAYSYKEDFEVGFEYNNFSSNNYGIYIFSDSRYHENENFLISGNSFWDNVYWDTYLFAVRYTDIIGNAFYSNGTYLEYCYYNTFSNNIYWNQTAVSPSTGVYFRLSGYNDFISNYLIDYDKGAYFNAGTSPTYYKNTIYNNYFDNAINAHEDHSEWYGQYSGTYQYWYTSPTPGTNIVGGPYIAGNFWSDYYGYDTDGDYIGDTDTPHNSSGYILGAIEAGESYLILRPDGTGIWESENFSEFTPLNGGDNYLEVDEEVFDENASFVNASGGGEMDTYSLEDFTGELIWNVSFHAMARATENECIILGWGQEDEQWIYGYYGTGIPLTEEWTEVIIYSDEGACFEGEGCWCSDWSDELGDDILLNETVFVVINDDQCDGAEWCDEGGGGPSTLYVSQVWVEVLLGEYGQEGDYYPLVYFPSPPTNITGEVNGTNNLTINWTKSVNADYTIVIRNESQYATTPYEGTEIYNSTGNTTNTPLMLDHYYTLIGYNSSDNTFGTPAFLYFGAIKIECYNESNLDEGLTFDLLFRNESGSQTYNMLNCVNPTWVDYEWIPHDTTVSITASSGTYRDRTITYDVEKYAWAHVIFYMNHGTLYYVKVIDEISDPIDDVYVGIYRYLNGSYQLIGSKYTDPYGMAGFYLVPLTEYQGHFEKSGYNTLTETFDTDPYYYGYSYPIIFRLTFAELTPPDTDELFKNITWSLEPNKRYHNNSFTIYFNITSSDSKLDYFRMIVWYINETTGVNDLLNDTTDYTAAGGSINYTVANVTGKYKVDCVFKKDGFVETDVQEEGSRYYFISWGGLFGSEAFDIIPDLIFYIILLIIAAVVTAFAFPFAGMGAGYIAMGILAFGFVLKPVTVAGVSCWAILAITALIYTIGLMLWSRI